MERTIKTAYNSTHPKDWVLCSKDSFVVKIATFANPQTVNDYFLTTMKLNWKSIFKNKPSSTKDSSDEMEETDYDQHVDFYFTNVINSLMDELLVFKKEIDDIPVEIWEWELIDQHKTWMAIRQKANTLLDQLGVTSRIYNDDYSTIYDSEGKIIRKGKNCS